MVIQELNGPQRLNYLIGALYGTTKRSKICDYQFCRAVLHVFTVKSI